jgi:hypothetical protein
LIRSGESGVRLRKAQAVVVCCTTNSGFSVGKTPVNTIQLTAYQFIDAGLLCRGQLNVGAIQQIIPGPERSSQHFCVKDIFIA